MIAQADPSVKLVWEDLLGVPYCPGGRTRKGLDCWGLVLLLLARHGLTVPDAFAACSQATIRDAQAGWSAEGWIRANFAGWQRLDPPTVGSVVVFGDGAPAAGGQGAAGHVGVLVAPGRFVHMRRGAGVTLSRLDRPPWDRSLVGAYVYRA